MDTEAAAARLERELAAAGFEAVDVEHVGTGWAVDFHVAPRMAHEDYNEFSSSVFLESGGPPSVVLRMPQVPKRRWDEAADMARRAVSAESGDWRVEMAPAEDTSMDVARPHLVWNPASRSVRPARIVSAIESVVDAYYGGGSGEGGMFDGLGF